MQGRKRCPDGRDSARLRTSEEGKLDGIWGQRKVEEEDEEGVVEDFGTLLQFSCKVGKVNEDER